MHNQPQRKHDTKKFSVERIVTNEQIKALGVDVFEKMRQEIKAELIKGVGQFDIKIKYGWRTNREPKSITLFGITYA